MDRYTSTAIVLISLIMAGCSGDSSRFVGVWEGRLPAPLKPDTPPDIRVSMERLRIVVRADGTATVVLQSMPFHGPWGGNDPIRIRLTKVLDKGLPPEKQFDLTLSAQGTVNIQGETITAKKIADRETSPVVGP